MNELPTKGRCSVANAESPKRSSHIWPHPAQTQSPPRPLHAAGWRGNGRQPMTKTPIAVALLVAASATPSLAHTFSPREVGYSHPVERTANHHHWRQSNWGRGHWRNNPWRRNDWRRQQWNRHDDDHHQGTRVSNPDTNSCIEGTLIGGLLGAGLGAALSRGDGRWIGVPVGGAAGALIGCQVDGG